MCTHLISKSTYKIILEKITFRTLCLISSCLADVLKGKRSLGYGKIRGVPTHRGCFSSPLFALIISVSDPNSCVGRLFSVICSEIILFSSFFITETSLMGELL